MIGYDTLYAIQDIEDDALVGVKSSARALGAHARLGVGICYALALARLGRGDLDACGRNRWRLLALLPAALHLARQVVAHRPGRRRGRAGPVPLEPLHRLAAVRRLPRGRLVVGGLRP